MTSWSNHVQSRLEMCGQLLEPATPFNLLSGWLHFDLLLRPHKDLSFPKGWAVFGPSIHPWRYKFTELGKSLWHNKDWLLLLSFLLLDCDSDELLNIFQEPIIPSPFLLGMLIRNLASATHYLGAGWQMLSLTPPGEILSPLIGNWKKEPIRLSWARDKEELSYGSSATECRYQSFSRFS